MKIIIGFVILIVLWISFEMWRAPMMDEETGKILRPAKKLKDLWRKLF